MFNDTFNDMTITEGHFLLSPREREEIEELQVVAERKEKNSGGWK